MELLCALSLPSNAGCGTGVGWVQGVGMDACTCRWRWLLEALRDGHLTGTQPGGIMWTRNADGWGQTTVLFGMCNTLRTRNMKGVMYWSQNNTD